MEVRNIAIIAHVDHGKTTLTDAIMRQTGMFSEGASMDTNDLERERGITIYAKNTATFYKDTKINIVDTPGHADFGSEVERVLRSIDSVLLLVDAAEGPMPQTRFVLKKSLELGLKPIVVINKIDKPAARPGWAEEEVLALFLELGATDLQADFKVVYAIGKEGVAMRALGDERRDLTPLLDIILEEVPAAAGDINLPMRAQPFSLGYDNYLGRLAVARVYDGTINVGSQVFVLADGVARSGKISKLFTFHGTSHKEALSVESGDIAVIAGLPDIFIGDTISSIATAVPLPAIKVDEPTITLNFLVNNSPFAGRDGRFLTSRQIRERLEKELEVNVGLRVDFDAVDFFKVYGRGELHIAILLENMRREGYELQVSQPQVIIKNENGQKLEPFEEVTVDTPSLYQGIIIEKLGKRRVMMKDLKIYGESVRIVFEGPTRGLLGYKNQFVVDTRGDGILTSRVVGFKPYAGEIEKKDVGSMTSMEKGKTLAFALGNLQDRGSLYISPGVEVYEGMVIGNTSKGEEMSVNPIKGKNLTNMRASGSDETIYLVPPRVITIESGLELMSQDEYLEITPKNVRIRKQQLTNIDRARAKRVAK